MNASFTEQPCEIILWFFLLHEMNGDINTGGLFTMFIPSSPCVLKGSCIFSTSEYISYWYQMQFSDMWNLWIRQGFFSELVNTVCCFSRICLFCDLETSYLTEIQLFPAKPKHFNVISAVLPLFNYILSSRWAIWALTFAYNAESQANSQSSVTKEMHTFPVSVICQTS